MLRRIIGETKSCGPWSHVIQTITPGSVEDLIILGNVVLAFRNRPFSFFNTFRFTDPPEFMISESMIDS